MAGSIQQMCVFLTGGAGFIGSHLAEELVRLGVAKLKIFDNLSTGSKSNLDSILNKPQVEFIYGDITDIEQVRKAIMGCNTLCHQAAMVSVMESIRHPQLCHKVNEKGFYNILVAAQENGIRRVVYASSSAVYGDLKLMPLREHYIGKCASPYALSKYVNECHASMYCKLYNMQCIGLRYFNVYGPRQDPSSDYAAVIPKFISNMRKNIAPTILGDGEQTRDFVYVNDIVNANILALTTQNPKAYDEVFNIGTGCQTSLNQLVNFIQNRLDATITPWYGDTRPADIIQSYADIQKASDLLKYRPSVELLQGLYTL